MMDRQQNSTNNPMGFLLVLSSDGKTGATGVVPTVQISKSFGAFALASGAITETGFGWYRLAGNAVDRNTLGDFILHPIAAGCDSYDFYYTIVGYDPFNQITGSGLTSTDLTNVAGVMNAALSKISESPNTSLDPTKSSDRRIFFNSGGNIGSQNR